MSTILQIINDVIDKLAWCLALKEATEAVRANFVLQATDAVWAYTVSLLTQVAIKRKRDSFVKF